MRRLATALVIVLACLCGTASAATTIGAIDPGTPSSSCMGTSYWVQETSASGTSYTVPSNGVITGWSHRANGASGRELGLRVFRLASVTSYTLVGSSGVQILTPGTVNSFSARIPVQAGDKLGLYVGNAAVFPAIGGGAGCTSGGGLGDLLHQGGASPEAAIGATASLAGTYAAIYRLNVSATVEPDVDGDGYGDESQDGCPASAATAGACGGAGTTPAPRDATAPRARVRARRDSIRDRKVAVRVTSDEAATVTVTGFVKLRRTGAARSYRLAGTKASLAAGTARKLELTVSKKTRRAVRRALRRHRKPRARLTIVLRDAAGNATTLRPSVPLRR